MAIPRKIFISYRRGDVPGEASRLYDELEREFGKANVFMDVNKMLAGQRFDHVLDEALSQCDVLISVIGRRWMEILSEHARSGERDFAHDEIAAALQRKIVVIPALVGRQGHMPSLPHKDDLPDDIRDLVLHHKHDIVHENFDRDAADLATAINSVLGGGRLARSWRAAAILGAIGVALTAVMLGYWMDMTPRPGNGPVPPRQSRPSTESTTVSVPKPDPDRVATNESPEKLRRRGRLQSKPSRKRRPTKSSRSPRTNLRARNRPMKQV